MKTNTMENTDTVQNSKENRSIITRNTTKAELVARKIEKQPTGKSLSKTRKKTKLRAWCYSAMFPKSGNLNFFELLSLSIISESFSIFSLSFQS